MKAGASDPSTSVIPKPPFARPPEPAAMFARRAARFRALAGRHDLAPYLRFLAAVADAQAAAAEGLPPPVLPDAAALARAERHAMPPLPRAASLPEVAGLAGRVAAGLAGVEMPEAARAAVDRVAAASDAERAAMAAGVLADAVPLEAMAEHALVAAAVQVAFARAAARLDAARLRPVGEGACPACGGPPVASVVGAWARNPGVRYAACATCATEWNVVRAKCVLCGATANVGLREIEGAGGAVKAECCGSCGCYVKILYREVTPGLDPVADDVASLGLDLLVRGQGFRRGAVNPFLVGA